MQIAVCMHNASESVRDLTARLQPLRVRACDGSQSQHLWHFIVVIYQLFAILIYPAVAFDLYFHSVPSFATIFSNLFSIRVNIFRLVNTI